MKYAVRISDIINAFSPEPLKADQMDEFYCADTMEFRMSDKYCSPMDDIFDYCRESGGYHAFLLLGHKGCGKSTELNRLSGRFAESGYPVKTIACSLDLDLFNIVYSDLFILMGEALLQIAQELNCSLDQDIVCSMERFWQEQMDTTVLQEMKSSSVEGGVSAETPGFLANFLQFFAKIKADLKFNEETRKEYRRKISARSSEWIGILGSFAEKIAGKTDGKRPIIIFEDLDKLDPEDAWRVFYQHAASLSGMPFSVIYTFPIGLSYDGRFSAMEGYFTTKTLPMIKIETIEGQVFEDGVKVIREVVERRAKLDLFEVDVLDRLIRYTGGSLRELFRAINAAAKRAERRNSESISGEDAGRALEELKTTLTRRIEKKDYNFLQNIHQGNKELIQDREMLLKMLQASVVLEYNGKRWHNVHPLVAEFLEEQGPMCDGRT